MRIWMIHCIYNTICYFYLERHPKKIDVLERILFLVQIHYLKYEKKHFYFYKTYIDGKNVRIPYLSDLLRVGPVDTFLHPEGTIYTDILVHRCKKIFEKYSKLSEAEIESKIQEIIKDGTYKKYYVLSTYSRQYLRKYARWKINYSTTKITKCVAYLLTLTVAILGWVLGSEILLIGVGLYESMSKAIMGFIGYGIGLIFTIIWLNWTKEWLQPTKFEIDLENKNQDLSNDNALRYEPRSDLDQKLVIMAKNIENSNEVESNELRIFEEVCNMVRSIKDRNPDVNYVVLLERTYDIEEIVNKEKPPKLYHSSISVFLTRNRVILERKKDAGEWPGILVDLVKVKGMKKREFYIEDNEACQDDLEYETNVYCNRADEYYENKEESEDILRSGNVKKIEWID